MGRSPPLHFLVASYRLYRKSRIPLRSNYALATGIVLPDTELTFLRLRHVRARVRHLVTSSASEVRLKSHGGELEVADISEHEQEIRGRTQPEFISAFPGLVQDVIAAVESPGAEDVAARLKEVCEYNVPHGKLNRGRLVVDAFASFANSPLGRKQLAVRGNLQDRAVILGWCVEWLQASLLVLDDLMDDSPLRRGRTSWHARTDVGIVAVNDGLFLKNCVFLLLEKHFAHLPSHTPLSSLFRAINLKTIFGQSLDMTSSWKPTLNLLKHPDCREALSKAFTRQRYESICINKTAMYTFVLPVLAGMRLAEIADSDLEARLSTLLQKFGLLFQSQDDYLDCFGDVSVTGKTGTDIGEGKCTWLMVEAVLRADDEEKETLARAYGRDDPVSAATVKDVYFRLGLPSIFEGFERSLRQELKEDIASLDGTGISFMFLLDLLDKMKKRQK